MKTVEQAWQTIDEYLTSTRYAVREPGTGRPIEKDFREIVERRMTFLDAVRYINSAGDEQAAAQEMLCCTFQVSSSSPKDRNTILMHYCVY